MKKVVRHCGIVVCIVLLAAVSYGQSKGDSGSFGIGVKGSLLGGGAEGAVRVSHRTNLRGGFNIFDYSRGFNKDGVAYNGQLSFKTVEAHYDIFPFAGAFHVSPGVLIYAATPITANASVPGNQTFSLGGTSYLSDPAPGTAVTGNGNIKFNQAAPMATIGWGNLIPRKSSKHFSVPVELGVAFQGSPKATLNLAGNVCNTDGTNCRTVASDSTVQANVLSEQTKINNSMRFFKAYPIISVGLGYKF
ncbi:MAG: hypothetical protein ACLQBK_03995 [Candidatus Sulfotelmatobacter sp.]